MQYKINGKSLLTPILEMYSNNSALFNNQAGYGSCLKCKNKIRAMHLN